MSMKTSAMTFAILGFGTVAAISSAASTQMVSVEKEWKARSGKMYETSQGEDTCSEGKLVYEVDSGGGIIRLGPAIQFLFNPGKIAQSTFIEVGKESGCRKRRETTITAREVQMRTDIDLCKSSRDNFQSQESLTVESDGRLTYELVRSVDGKTERSKCVFKEIPKEASADAPERAAAADEGIKTKK